MKALLRVFRFLRWLLVVAAIFGIGVGILKVLIAHSLGRVVASAAARDAVGLREHAFIGIASVCAHALLGFFQAFLTGRLGQLFLARVRSRVALRLVGATAAGLRGQHSGDVASRMTSDLDAVDYLGRDGLPTLLARTVLSLLAAGYMLYYDWRLTLLALAPVPLLLLLSHYASRPLATMGRAAQEALGEASVQMKEAVAGAELVRTARMQSVLSARMGASLERWASASIATGARVGLLYASGMLLAIAPWIVVFSVGGYSVVRGNSDLGMLFSFAEILGAVSFPMTELPALWGQIKPRFASVERVRELLAMEAERQGGEPARLTDGELLALEDVTVTFPGSKQSSIQGVSISVKRGQTAALVGASGSGKSTLLRLLSGDLSPEAGRALFGEKAVSALDLASLRSHLAIADGDAFLFDATIEENLRMVRPGATLSDLREAARMAEAGSFIEALPDGYAAQVGENGERLSGGERQRVSLARALLVDAPVLILDEATSAVPEDMEARILASLRSGPEPKTLIVATHRLRPIRDFDVIFVLDAGRLVAKGTHVELMERCAEYAKLYRLGEGSAA